LGAVFYAAHLSTSIKVPEHKIKDITPYGVTATIKLTRPADALEASDKEDPAAGNQEGKGDDDDDDDDDIDEEAEDEVKLAHFLHHHPHRHQLRLTL
jgi:phosphopantothenoylcysteine synthetase/decarboxylase